MDCGITNHAELRELLENGVEVIVTDHHTPGKTPPPGLVVHPALTPDLKEKPTGAGVAFLLLWALHERLGLPHPWSTPTSPRWAPSPTWPPLGLEPGLGEGGPGPHPRLLLGWAQASGRGGGVHGEGGGGGLPHRPRINAASRLGEAEKALRLLLTDDAAEAQALVGELHRLNARRQTLEEAMLRKLLPRRTPRPRPSSSWTPRGTRG